MGLVTGCAVSLIHRCGMRLVAGETFGNVAMGVGMAEITGECRMLAGVVHHLLLRVAVAGHADLLLLSGDLDIQGLVWIMTTEARLGKVVMGIARVAIAALGDIVLRNRPVALVTLEAGNFCFMGSSAGGYLPRLLLVTLNAVASRQNCFLGQNRRGKASGQQNDNDPDPQLLHSAVVHCSPPEILNPITDMCEWPILA